MFRRKLKSALFVDFENVQLDPDAMANALAWIEDGAFEDSGRRRKLLIKTIYWNSTAERNRARYEALGFEVVLCEKYANLKNGADIRMAMDMVEARMRRPNIQEFILISKDSDFVPVLQRLRERRRKTTVLVDESKPAIYTVYSNTADTTFPLRRLMGEGRTYVRPKRGLLDWFGVSRHKSTTVASVGNPTKIALTPKAAVTERPSIDHRGLDVAVEKIVAVASRNSGQSTGRQSVTKELRTVPGFTSNGADRYFGHGSYDALIRVVAERDTRVVLRAEKGGGMSLIFVAAASSVAQSTKPKAQQSARA
jgi:NYN domain